MALELESETWFGGHPALRNAAEDILGAKVIF